jgi:lipoprotein
MRKKTIVFLTTLSILTMSCVGFSAWSIATTPTEETFEGEVIVDDAVRLIDVGLSYNLTQYPIQGFEYYPITDNEGNTSIYFSSTKLIYTIIVTKSLYEKVAFDNVSQYYLDYECYYIYPKTNSIDLITDTTFITAPTELFVRSVNLENAFFSVKIQKEKKEYDANNYMYSLTAAIPIKSTYENSLNQLVVADIKSTTSVPISLELAFTNPTNLLNDNFESFQSIEMHYSLRIKEK